MANCCVTCVVYFVIFCNFAGGIYYITVGATTNNTREMNPTIAIVQGVFCLLLGLLLLVGVIKRKPTLILIYLGICLIGLLLGTASSLYFAITAGSAYVICVTLLVVVIAWLIQYAVYIYFKDLVEQRKREAHIEQGRVHAYQQQALKS